MNAFRALINLLKSLSHDHWSFITVAQMRLRVPMSKEVTVDELRDALPVLYAQLNPEQRANLRIITKELAEFCRTH